MTWITARDRLARFTAADQEPKLTDQELDDLLATSAQWDEYGSRPEYDQPWRAGAEVDLGTISVPTSGNGHTYVATVAGVTASTEPTWPTADAATVVDGTVTWTENGTATWVPTFNLAAAVAAGWQLKAGRCAGNFSFSADGASFSKQQVYEHCMEQFKIWADRATIGVGGLGTFQFVHSSLDYLDTIGNINEG